MDAWIIACLAWSVWVVIFLWAWGRAFNVLARVPSEQGWARDSDSDPYPN
jgi:hypothetical protein